MAEPEDFLKVTLVQKDDDGGEVAVRIRKSTINMYFVEEGVTRLVNSDGDELLIQEDIEHIESQLSS